MPIGGGGHVFCKVLQNFDCKLKFTLILIESQTMNASRSHRDSQSINKASTDANRGNFRNRIRNSLLFPEKNDF